MTEVVQVVKSGKRPRKRRNNKKKRLVEVINLPRAGTLPTRVRLGKAKGRKRSRRSKGKNAPVAVRTAGVQSRMPKVSMYKDGASCFIEGQDYLTPVSIDNTVGTVAYQTVFTPGWFSDTRMSHFAMLFERWRCLHLAFHYTPASASTTAGSFVGYVDYDVNDEVQTPIDLKIAFAHKGAKSTNVWSPMTWNFTDNLDHKQMTDLYTRMDLASDVTTNNINLKWICPCRFILATNVAGAADAVVGNLSVTYRIEFYCPSMQPPADSSIWIENNNFTITNGDNLLKRLALQGDVTEKANMLGLTVSPLGDDSPDGNVKLNGVRAGEVLMAIENWVDGVLPPDPASFIILVTGTFLVEVINTIVSNTTVFRRTILKALVDGPLLDWKATATEQIAAPSFELLRLSLQAFKVWDNYLFKAKGYHIFQGPKDNSPVLATKHIVKVEAVKEETPKPPVEKRRSKRLSELPCECSPLEEHDGMCPVYLSPFYSKYVSNLLAEGRSPSSFNEFKLEWKKLSLKFDDHTVILEIISQCGVDSEDSKERGLHKVSI